MKRILKIFLIALALLLVSAALFSYYVLLTPNISLLKREQPFVFVATGSVYDEVLASLDTSVAMKSKFTFGLTAGLLNYPERVRAGRYKIYSGISNLALLKLLRSGKQTPVNLVFNSTRTKEQFAERISEQLEAKYDTMLQLLNDKEFLSSYGLNPHTALTLFIPNTYEFFWNTSSKGFFYRMKKEHDTFWNEERKQKAAALGLSEKEVTVVASIVEQETQGNDEKPILAGVYLNRLRKNMKLDADPTLIFALGDYTIKRVLNEHKKIDSPYNTYKNNGLPPGPICIPSIASIDAVLNRVPHNYLYFCAKDDFSGYHVFASTYAQHQINARRFHSALNRRGIK
ncbi:MAG TPA: endolytic transglycosylase MltG [Bacteroidia bacterium]|nr:endolytic transglycosylase MltG [Bacteroidia bacterium]